jgi:acetyl-CoA synthetase
MSADEIHPVPPGFATRAHVKAADERRYQASIGNPDAFWAKEAQSLQWMTISSTREAPRHD